MLFRRSRLVHHRCRFPGCACPRERTRNYPATLEIMTEFQERIRDVIAALGPGEVVSYGEVARRAGRRRAARSVGAFLAQFGSDLPWWRVVRADGQLAAHKVTDQARRLRAEGIDVEGGRVIDALPPC